jgi:hypothetical protein
MPTILYTVRATCPDLQTRGRYLAWLSPNHIMEVIKGGAAGARIILPLPDDRSGQTPAGQQAGTARPTPTDAAPAICETQYTFPSRKAFDDYVRLHAPALRADGLKHFGPDSGVTYERAVAEIAAEL